LAALAVPSVAAANWFSPQDNSGSPNAVKIKTLYLITFILGMIIFLAVEALLIYSLVKFRHRRRGGTQPAQIRGNTPLEVGWTLGAAGILVILAVVTFIFLGGIKNPASSKPNGFVAEAKESGMKFADSGSSDGGKLEFATKDQAAPPGPANKTSRSTSTASSTCGASTTRAASRSSATTTWSCRRARRWSSTSRLRTSTIRGGSPTSAARPTRSRGM
jgi:hypothetical protein